MRLAMAWPSRALGFGLEHEPALLRDRLVELGHVAKKRGDVEPFAVLAARARLDAGDGEECVEGLDQAIGLLDGSLQRLAYQRHEAGTITQKNFGHGPQQLLISIKPE